MQTDQLTRRAIAAHMRQEGALQPAIHSSGPATAKGLDYIVLRNVAGVLSVYRVLPKKRPGLKRLKRWPREIE
ncbi:MAG: hypothetical protein WBC18_14655 [Ottowia sp.]|uniref:hypothetical protein n=1 Tax=Ottowia sp. TaxID=1898956 RepID=UPI003C75C248